MSEQDPINSVTPGVALSSEDKNAMASANLKETENAHKLAAEARANEGNQQPTAHSIAGSIRDKLEQLPPEEGAPVQPTTPQ